MYSSPKNSEGHAIIFKLGNNRNILEISNERIYRYFFNINL